MYVLTEYILQTFSVHRIYVLVEHIISVYNL